MRWIVVAAIAAFAVIGTISFARSQEIGACPPNNSCKVITLTVPEEQAITGERGILDTAQQGRPLDLTGAVQYFRKKIEQAPAGKVANPKNNEETPPPKQ